MRKPDKMPHGPQPVQDAAAEAGVVDALLFRRVSVDLWAHVGGIGRGRGWAGVVDVATGTEPLAWKVPGRSGEVRRFTYERPERVLGPYYAVDAAIVRVSQDVVVVLGNPASPLTAAASPDALRLLAEQLNSSVAEVGPAKRLADELEVLHAVRAVTTGSTHDVPDTLRHVLGVALQSLSCEVGFLRAGNQWAAMSSWRGVDIHDPRLSAALDTLQEHAADGPWCAQDGDGRALPPPLGQAQGVRSVLVVQAPIPVGGVLVVAHTDAAPRGFTTLCQQLARQLADAAGVVVHTAILRDELRTAAAEHADTARRDALTGLGNRLAFDEAVAAAEDHVDGGGSLSVLILDIDGLKQVNDTHGHAAGDDLLRRCARVLREQARSGEVCVRLGGDEFAVLLPFTGSVAEDRLATLTNLFGRVTSWEGSVAASIGMATATPGGSVADTVRDADAAMYTTKRARRTAAAPPPAPSPTPGVVDGQGSR